MITSSLIAILLLGVGALIVTAALSPLETLSWWAGWTENEIDDAPAPEPTNRSDNTQNGRPPHYIVYLSGVASISGRFLLPREKAFIRRLKARMPDAVIIADVFPYSPKGLPLLASPRVFDRLWRRVQKLKLDEKQSILSALINLRNIFQVLVSADHRYGPIFSQGAASVIENALYKHGYRAGAPLAVVGYSGGAQMALGATPFLKARLKAPIDVIGLGGVLASDPGLAYVRRLHHIIGARDNIQKVGAILFPERWAAMAYSDWNAATRDGRIAKHVMPGMTHAGVKGYFGRPKVNGVSNAERTVEKIAMVLSMKDQTSTPE